MSITSFGNKSSNPLVSVVVCVYNGARYLAPCLDSVLSQTHKFIEIVIVDDGSSDNSLEIIHYYASLDHRIRWFSRMNAGLAASRNFAFSMSKGDWIAIIDQDDICHPDRVSKQLLVALKYPSAGLIFSDTDYIDQGGLIVGSHLRSFNLPNEFIPKKYAGNLLLTLGCFVDSESLFLRKEVVESLAPLSDSLSYACDYEYFIRIGMSYDFAYTPEKLSAWRIHPNQESVLNKKRFKDYRAVLKSYFIGKDTYWITRLFICFNMTRSYFGEYFRLSLVILGLSK